MGRKRKPESEATEPRSVGGSGPRSGGRTDRNEGRTSPRGGGRTALGTRWGDVLKSFFFGRAVDEATSTRLREISGLCMTGLAAFLLE